MVGTSFPSHRLAVLRNKGLVMILWWCFTLSTVFNFLFMHNRSTIFHYGGFTYRPTVVVGITSTFYPIFGWIADVRWGRYRTVQRALWLMWMVSLMYAVTSIVLYHFPHILIAEGVNVVMAMLLCFSLGGLQANIVQFGVDQIPDASSADISAYTSWYVWSWHFSKLVVSFTSECTCSEYSLLPTLIIPVCVTVGVCLDCLCHHRLIKEPVSSNPFTLIYNVLKYALRNKHPYMRSAFTYWEDKPYSRIDLAQTKYGGPFTTEQVEDVKTFFRLVLIGILPSLFIGFSIVFAVIPDFMRYHLQSTFFKHAINAFTKCHSTCYAYVAIDQTGFIVSVVLIPLYELGLYRLLGRLSIPTRFCIGCLCIVLYLMGNLGLEVTGHLLLPAGVNTTTCLLVANQATTYDSLVLLPVDYSWVILPKIVYGIGQFLTLASVIEFVCAQTPYSMKGLFIGFFYFFLGVSLFLAYLVFLPIEKTLSYWPAKEQHRCGIWLLLSGILLLLVLLMAFCCPVVWYKKRRRDDMEQNEQMFVVNYYDYYLSVENQKKVGV